MEITELAARLAQLASEGLAASPDEYAHDRYEHITRLASELAAMTGELVKVQREHSGDLVINTPIVGVDAAIFDAQGRILLIQRADDQKWAMPGGAADVGESAAEGAVREVWEETGLRVRPTRLLGVYDALRSRSILQNAPSHVRLAALRAYNALHGGSRYHLWHITFECEMIGGALTVTNETLAYGYFAEGDLPPLHSSHNLRVPDAFRRHQDGGATFQ